MAKSYARIVVSNKFRKKMKIWSAEANQSVYDLSEELADLVDIGELKERKRKKYEFKI